jgi:outer membrane biogenesis lipoprotein LolB
VTRRIFTRALAGAALCVLASCATAPIAVELNGRVSVRVGERLETAKIVWSRGRAEERLQFFTPFGSQVAEVIVSRDGPSAGDVTLRRGSETVSASSMAQLTESLLGAALNTDEIARWVQGAGLREDQVVEVTLKDGAVWQVTAEKFQEKFRPDRVVTRLLAIKGDTVVRLFVDEWKRQ